MHAAVMARAADADCVIMAAAVADYAPAGGPHPSKRQKGSDVLALELAPTVDILADLGRWRGAATRPLLVGFAAETGDPVGRAREKLRTKRVDLIVANDISRPGAGFEVDTNEVTLVSEDRDEHLPCQPKAAVAGVLLDRIEARLAGLEPAAPQHS